MANFRYELLKGVPCIQAHVQGKTLAFTGRFILDTGAYMTIIRTARIDAIGYSARDATKPFSTESIIGREEGYCLKITCLELFGKTFSNHEVAALDLPERYHIDGLIGMNILNQFDWCLHPNKSIISIE
ncbi:MAG: retropepsin-like domain-containing protein [Deltaproteobacteria bacterium]|nr:retropepsin-like domain-containing protein [Deltaproteobacteria bacterium]